MTDLSLLLLTGLLVGVGALVQSAIGFGIAVVAAPLVILIAPELMPGALLLCGFLLPVIQLAGGQREVAWRLLWPALAGRLLLTPVGVLAVVALPAEAIGALVGVLVLVGVAASIWTVHVEATPWRAAGAGVITGVSGTAAAIGGPFLALVLQRERPEVARGTLAVFFLAGSAIAMTSLALAGAMHREQFVAGLVWVPFIALGHLAAAPVRRRLDPERFRRAVLVLATVASLVVIARALLA